MKLPTKRIIKKYNQTKAISRRKKTEKQAKGDKAEQAAIKKLQDNGLTLIERNFYFHKVGEIDVIMQENDCLVFVEVRYRNSNNIASPAETISHSKQQKIIKTALFYLQKNQLNYTNCRFDVVCVTNDHGQLQLEWLKSAFTA